MKRKVRQTIEFKEVCENRFQNLYSAQVWCEEEGFNCGSLDRDNPVAIMKGEYNLPQKWHNFTREDKASVHGVIEYSGVTKNAKITIYEI